MSPESVPRPFSELHATGMLWLLNRVCLHPRGFALALHYPDGVDPLTVNDGEAEQATGEPVGWSLLWDGTECGTFPESVDDEMFAAAEAFLASHHPSFVIEREGVKVAFRDAEAMADAVESAALADPVVVAAMDRAPEPS